MTGILARHRAPFGILALLAMAGFFLLPSLMPRHDDGLWPYRLAFALVAVIGFLSIMRSPYWSVIYREAPLKRAITGASDLDERELALRDRANGLTYYLFMLLNLLALFAASLAVEAGWIAIDARALNRAIIPYIALGITLPVIMLEWFEPSYLWAAGAAEDEL